MILRLLALAAIAVPLCSCVGLGAGSEGVFTPTAVQPPSFERGNVGSGKADAIPAAEPQVTRPARALSVPSR